MTYTEFILIVFNRPRISSHRFGQHFFNILWEHRPDICKKITGTDLDPYYRGQWDLDFWSGFYNWLQENWDSNE